MSVEASASLEELLASLAIQGITLAGRFAFSAAGTMALQHLTDYIKKKRSNDRATPEQEKTAAPSTPATSAARNHHGSYDSDSGSDDNDDDDDDSNDNSDEESEFSEASTASDAFHTPGRTPRRRPLVHQQTKNKNMNMNKKKSSRDNAGVLRRKLREQLRTLEMKQKRLESRLSIVTPAIDLAEIIAARGNSTMSAVLPMTHSLRHDLDIFSKLLERLGDIDSHDSSNSSNSDSADQTSNGDYKSSSVNNSIRMVGRVLDEIDGLLVKLDDVVPFLNLALTTCGANVGSAMAPSVSPGRLMQASNCLIEASSRATAALSTVMSTQQPAKVTSGNSNDHQNEQNGRQQSMPELGVTLFYLPASSNMPNRVETAVGPLFPLRLFSLFTSSVRAKGMSDVTWCEEFAKCHAQLTRSIDIQPQSTQDDWSASVDTVRSAGFEYHLLITEDLNDGRYHEEIADMRLKSGMIVPGRVRYIPVTNIQRLCYTSSGNLLNIEESRSPVLVLKVVDDNKKNSTVPDWIALELFTEDSDTDDDDTESETDDDEDEEEESESATADDTETGQDTEDGSECEASGADGDDESDNHDEHDTDGDQHGQHRVAIHPVSTSATLVAPSTPQASIPLSVSKSRVASPMIARMSDNSEAAFRQSELGLLEYMLRLSALETCEQRPHQLIPDEKINLFISEDTSKNATMRPQQSSAPSPLSYPRTPNLSSNVYMTPVAGLAGKRSASGLAITMASPAATATATDGAITGGLTAPVTPFRSNRLVRPAGTPLSKRVS